MHMRIFLLLSIMSGSFIVSVPVHHHNHYLSHADKDLLMYGSREQLAQGYAQKCDENSQQKERIKQLENEHWQFKLFAKGVGTGVILSVATVALIYINSR